MTQKVCAAPSEHNGRLLTGCVSSQSFSPLCSDGITVSYGVQAPAPGVLVRGQVLPVPGGVGGGDGRGLAPPVPPPGHLDYFYYKSAKPKFEGDHYHPLQFRKFVSERLNASVRVRGIDPIGAGYRAVIPCTYRWSAEVRRRNLAVIYSWVDYAEDRGYDPSEVAFLTLTVRHPSRHTYPAAARCVDDLRRGWSLVSRDFRRCDLEYLRVIEPGELNGYAHYHLPVLGASESQCEALIARWCKVADALPGGQQYSVVRDIRQTGAYISKYLTKTLDSELDYRWLELCYRKRIRVFSMSRAARAYIAAKYRSPLAGLGVFGDACMSWDLSPGAEDPPAPEG